MRKGAMQYQNNRIVYLTSNPLLPSSLNVTSTDDRDFSSAPAQTLTGWAAGEKTLTDYDKQEIAGYKEDIDSLLTFLSVSVVHITRFFHNRHLNSASLYRRVYTQQC